MKRHERRLGDASETAYIELLKAGEVRQRKERAPAPVPAAAPERGQSRMSEGTDPLEPLGKSERRSARKQRHAHPLVRSQCLRQNERQVDGRGGARGPEQRVRAVSQRLGSRTRLVAVVGLTLLR